jgi:FG-GAP-like repeat
MNRKNIGIIICIILIIAVAVPAVGIGKTQSINSEKKDTNQIKTDTPLQSGSRDGWVLQWSHAYGGNGEAEFAQPVGDIDGDGINEVIIGGYETTSMCRIISYNTTQNTYVQEYSWTVGGGVPSGACVADLNEDGSLILIVSWAYSTADGVYAYHYDGTTLTQLDWYYGTGVDFVFDVYACDYNDDGHMEVLIANAPNMGPGDKHVTALAWNSDTQHFYYGTSWSCPGGASMECPMVWSGDVDNDGFTEVIADVSDSQSSTAGTWALNWNMNTQSWDGVPVWTNYGSATVYGDGVADIDGDGIPEIGIGCYGGTPQGWLFEWDGSTYQQVWNRQYPGGQPTIESVALGDADNDGHNEFCFGTGNVHVIGWNGTGYYEKATLTDPTGMLAGMNIGDFDSDGRNELKGCEILSGTGSEFIWKYSDTSPPVTICTLDGEMNGTAYISDVTVTLTATDTYSGVDYTTYKLDNGTWTTYDGSFVVSSIGNHFLRFYSVDKAGNQEAQKNTSFTIQHLVDILITIKGGVGISATIKNIGTTTKTMMPWNITLDGKHIIVGKTKSGMILQLNPGEEVTEKLTVLGIGKTTITVIAGDTDKNATGHVFLIFVWGVK